MNLSQTIIPIHVANVITNIQLNNHRTIELNSIVSIQGSIIYNYLETKASLFFSVKIEQQLRKLTPQSNESTFESNFIRGLYLYLKSKNNINQFFDSLKSFLKSNYSLTCDSITFSNLAGELYLKSSF